MAGLAIPVPILVRTRENPGGIGLSAARWTGAAR
jgi:hypothetical protein